MSDSKTESRNDGKQKPRDPINDLRFVRRREVRELTGWSDATLWRRMRDGLFPRPCKDVGLDVWRYKDVWAALESATDDTANDA